MTFAAAVLGLASPVDAQVYRLVPNQSSDGYRLHTPSGQTYSVTPNYGFRKFGEEQRPTSYTIKSTPAGGGDLWFEN